MPDYLTQNLRQRHRAKISAVGAVNLDAAHIKRMTIFKKLVHPLDQQAIPGLAKDNLIANPDFTRGKRKTRDQHIIALPEIRKQAVAADSE